MNLLIDGSSLLWRVYQANKSKNKTGIPINIYSFITSVRSLAETYNTREVYIAWDKKLSDGINFRQLSTNGNYKDHRDKNEAEKVYECQPAIHEITEILGCKNMYPRLMEADDVIAWLTKTLDGENLVVTTDGDMLQLINNKTSVYNPRKNLVIDHKNFSSVMNMPIENYLVYKAILGDTSDNIEGLRGYGPVNAKKLAVLWKNKTAHLDSDKINIIEKNMKLMDLSYGYLAEGPMEVNAYEAQLNSFNGLEADFDKFAELCRKYEFKSIIKSMDKWECTFKTPKLLSILNNLVL